MDQVLLPHVFVRFDGGLGTMRHKSITYPKNSGRIIFEIAVIRLSFSELIFGKLPDTYCVYVS